MPCSLHPLKSCERPACDIEVSGSPCPNYSALGNGEEEDGDSGKILLTICKMVLTDEPCIFLHENVRGFKSDILIEILDAKFQHCGTIEVDPSDSNVKTHSRPRILDVFRHKTKTEQMRPQVWVPYIHDPLRYVP